MSKKYTNKVINIDCKNNLLDGLDKIFISENNPIEKIKIKNKYIIMFFSKNTIGKNKIRNIPPVKGMFFFPKIF